MRQTRRDFARPYGLHRDFEFVRAGPEGVHWRGQDGMVVRIAAAEHGRAQTSMPESHQDRRGKTKYTPGRSGAR
jgi:hypothetical protein